MAADFDATLFELGWARTQIEFSNGHPRMACMPAVVVEALIAEVARLRSDAVRAGLVEFRCVFDPPRDGVAHSPWLASPHAVEEWRVSFELPKPSRYERRRVGVPERYRVAGEVKHA